MIGRAQQSAGKRCISVRILHGQLDSHTKDLRNILNQMFTAGPPLQNKNTE